MTYLVGWADQHGRLPSEAWELYKEHPRDFTLLMAYSVYKAEREKAEMEKSNKKTSTHAPSSPPSMGRR